MWKQVRFYFALAKAVVKRDKKKITYGFIGLLLIIFVLRILIPASFPKAVYLYSEFRKPTFIEAVVGKPSHPNPLFDNTETEKEISRLIFRGLTKINKDGQLVGDLAESFKQISPTEYIFNLRKDIFWHDGQQFTADDVVYMVKLTQDAIYNSPLSSNFKDVTVEKISDFSVKLKLKEPFSPFLYVTTAGIIPSHISLKQYKPVGTGPFSVKKIEKNKIVLSSKKMNIVFNFYETIDDAKAALKLGRAHALGGISPQEIEGLEAFGGKKLYTSPLGWRQAVVYFNTKFGPLKERNIRQAVSYLVDKEKIRELVGGDSSTISKNEFPLKNWVLANPSERYPLNPEKAKNLLEAAGYKKKDGEWIKEKEKEPFTLNITSLDDPELNSIVNLIKEFWVEFGIKVEAKTVDGAALREDVLPNRNFQILINFQEVPPDPDQYVMWHTTQTSQANITGITSPKLDKLLEDARKISDQKQRAERYSLFTTLLLDEAPVIFLYYPQYAWFVSNKVSGLDFTNFAFPSDRFDSYNKWSIKRSLF